MLFNSFQFLLFFAAFVVAYFSLPQRRRWILLLAASYYFYMCWRPGFILLIIISTLIDYSVGRLLGVTRHKNARRALLTTSLVLNLGLLFTFKYLDFFASSLNTTFDFFGASLQVPLLDLLLPVGISFYTFQTLSYTIDVYRGETPPQKHLGIFAVYVAFFPQLVAGPIERSNRLMPQFLEKHAIKLERVRGGLQLMLWGLFKKVVVADLASALVDTVYADPTAQPGPVLVLATFFFAMQIYADFSGYSDIAIGAARIIGIDLMTNFRQPYFSRSISEFWQRWHISLSTWFRDYVYVPLGGNRMSSSRTLRNLVIVFLVSGLWHGAAWTYVIWGALHAFYLIVEKLTWGLRLRLTSRVKRRSLRTAMAGAGMAWVFLLVLVGWVFFRSRSIPEALYVLSHSVEIGSFHLGDLQYLGLPRFSLVVLSCATAAMLLVDYVSWSESSTALRLWRARPFRWAAYAACFYAIVCFGVFGEVSFIYFQF